MFLPRIKFDLEPLACEMLDQLPKEIWKSKTTTFLDPAMAGGQFPKEVEKRLRAAGHSDANIAKRVFGIAEDTLDLGYAVNRHDLVGTYKVGNALEMDWKMKFDVVITNPPYQNTNGEASSGKLWPQFVKKALGLVKPSGLVVMVTPNSWTKGNIAPHGSGKIFGLLKVGNLLTINNIDCSKHFHKVGVTFSYFVYQDATYSGKTKLIQNGKEIDVDIKNIYTLPKNIGALSIIQKFYRHHQKFAHTLITNTRDHKIVLSEKGKHTIVTGGKKVKTNDTTYYDRQEKIIFPWAADVRKVFKGRLIAGEQSIYFLTEGKGKELYSVLTSKLYRFCNDQVKMAFHNEGMRSCPIVPLNKVWTDKELYKHFGLTKEEVAYVEAHSHPH